MRKVCSQTKVMKDFRPALHRSGTGYAKTAKVPTVQWQLAPVGAESIGPMLLGTLVLVIGETIRTGGSRVSLANTTPCRDLRCKSIVGSKLG
jgi:hypothetical protein